MSEEILPMLRRNACYGCWVAADIITADGVVIKNWIAAWRVEKNRADALAAALREVVRISDRKHDAWDAAHKLLDDAV